MREPVHRVIGCHAGESASVRADPPQIDTAFAFAIEPDPFAVRREIQAATQRGQTILLTGVTMGGGPSHWAVEDHLKAGYGVFSTPAAARSFNDDLEEIARMGIELVSEDEAAALDPDVRTFTLRDLDLESVLGIFRKFGVRLDDLALIAAAVFDHGAAPPKYSDRKYRFEYIEEVITAHNRLSAFAYPAERVPPRMTRMQSVVDSAAGAPAPLMMMDTAPAAVLGALLDEEVERSGSRIVANIGNFHTLAFRLGDSGIEGVLEHHTGFMTPEKLDHLFHALADGSLTDEEVFNDQGHGARILADRPLELRAGEVQTVVVGPRRRLMTGSRFDPHFAAPFGDMMLVGCFGMLSAARDLYPELADELHEALGDRSDTGTAPWEF